MSILNAGPLTMVALALHVTVEPVDCEPAAHSPNNTGLVCDLAVRDLWSTQTKAFVDFRIMSTDAQS